MSVCKICNGPESEAPFFAMEMLNGTKQKFRYSECKSCRSIQLIDIPDDLSSYYQNSSYGSFSVAKRSPVKALLRKARNARAVLGKGGLVGYILNRRNPVPPDFTIIGKYAKLNSKVLDVGCGMGAYISDLKDVGFHDVSGIDPYLEKEVVHPNGAYVRRLKLTELTEKYDVIISHHSFEHVDDPYRDLSLIRRALEPGGTVIMTVPVAEDLYRKYKENCYLIQAPQHFFLFSIEGMKKLSEIVGLEIVEIIRDATNTVDWMASSELWKKGTSHCEMRGSPISQCTAAEVGYFKEVQKDQIANQLGDNVTFILKVKSQ